MFGMVVPVMSIAPLQSSFSHFSFRDDAMVQDVGDWLANHRTRIINILDCGCHDGRLAKMMMAAGLELSRIRYFVFDVADASVQAVRAEQERGVFKDYARFEIVLREIIDMAGYKAATFHLIVVNNLLHEVKPEYIPRVLHKFNELLARPTGKLAIIDMEELPTEECEPYAITWSANEVAAILKAGGFRPTLSTHH